MDNDRTEGTAAQAEGSVKEAIGKVTGDAALEAEGIAQTSAGQARRTLGLAKSEARVAVKDHE